MRCLARLKTKGMLIVFSLLFTVVLLMLIGAVAILSRQGRFVSQNYANDVAATLAAEAGVADAIEQLNEDNTWAPQSPYTVVLPNGEASYTIQFAAGPTLDPDLSVNNLFTANAVDGPAGANSVPATSVYLVINGSAGGTSRKVHVALQATPFRTMRGPFVASGKITLKGEVEVKGVRGFEDWTRVAAGIHSNLSGTVSEAITWAGEVGERAYVDGQITASSIAANAIDMRMGPSTNYQATGGEANGEGAKKFPRIDVEKLYNRARDQGVPTFSPPGVGGVRLNGGDRRITSDTEINGDLVLNDCNLFVDGNLRVNGSIKGNGSVFVNGDTRFSGAAEVAVGSDGHIALYSQGHVKLDGFSGSDFLDSAASSDPATFARPIQVTRQALGMLQSGLSNNYTGNNNTSYGGEGSEVDQSRALLGQYLPQSYIDQNPYLANEGFTNSDSRSIDQLRDGLRPLLGDGTPEDDQTIRFLLGKLDRLEKMLGPKREYIDDEWVQYVDNNDVRRYIDDGTVTKGLLDFINDGDNSNNTNRARRLLASELRALEFDALGTSYFKGLIFSGGSIHSSNDIEVFGGLYAQRSANSPDPVDIGGETYNAGDVFLDRGCRVTYVEELLENSASASSRNLVVPVYWALPGR